MLGFGLTSAVMCVAKDWFERHWRGVAATARCSLFGPLMVVANLLAQQVPFNAIFLVSDPAQKWRLLANFVLYLLPFLAGALLSRHRVPEGASGPSAASISPTWPARACAASLFLARDVRAAAREPHRRAAGCSGCAGSVAVVRGARRAAAAIAVLVVAGGCVGCGALPRCRRCSASPSSPSRTTRASPTRASSPTPSASTRAPRRSATSRSTRAPTCISRRACRDNAAFNLPEDAATNAYLGLYIDGDGPSGIIRDLPRGRDRLFPLPADGLSVRDQEATRTPSSSSSAAASRPPWRCTASSSTSRSRRAIRPSCNAFRTDQGLRDFTGDILNNPKRHVIDYDGRLYLANTDRTATTSSI